jgi:hypothetical protein
VSSMEAFQRAVAPVLHVKLPTTTAMASNPDSGMGEECQKADLDAAMGRALEA